MQNMEKRRNECISYDGGFSSFQSNLAWPLAF